MQIYWRCFLHCFYRLVFSCTSKYVGEYCQHLNPCHTGPGPRCQNGGSCQVRVSAGGSPSFTCLCPLGFSASLCEIPIANSCDRRPCLNGGTCSLRSLEAYQCSCAPGYTGIIIIIILSWYFIAQTIALLLSVHIIWHLLN